jgi:SNF2 family DNA or RNA helicase
MSVRPKIKRIVGLTGTPAGNGLLDLWAEMKVIDKGRRLGRFITGYRNRYFKADSMNPYTGQVYSYAPLPGAEDRIYEKISDITISMKALDHIIMPELLSRKYEVSMSSDERKKYDRLAKDMILPISGGEITASSAAVLSGKLSQMASGCIYDDDGKSIEIHDRKLDALEDLIEAANGKPVLIAYWFRHDLARIKKRFSEARVLDKPIDISAWNAGRIKIGLMHPASSGHGLNLQAGGSTLIWFGLTWSLELYEQTCARLYRQGQKHTVVIEHIVTKGTIDEDILAALKRKDKTQSALIDAVKANLCQEEAK